MYYNSAAGVFLTNSITHPQIEHIWVFPLLYGFRTTRADMPDKEASLESTLHNIYICRNSCSVDVIPDF